MLTKKNESDIALVFKITNLHLMSKIAPLPAEAPYCIFDIDQYVSDQGYLQRWFLVWDFDPISRPADGQRLRIFLKWRHFSSKGYVYETSSIVGWSSELVQYIQDLLEAPIFRSS